jgi:hypothetical protein
VSGLDRFEHLMEQMVEGSVGRMFRNQVQPADIGRRLERAMEARPLISVDGTIVPNDYRVHLNPEDAATFREIEGPLCESFEEWLTTQATERGYRFMGTVRVRLVPDPQVRRRDIQVQANMEAPEAAQQHAPQPPPRQQPPPQAPQRYQAPPPQPRPSRPVSHDEQTALGAPHRPQMVAPLAGTPTLRAPTSPISSDIVAHFVLQQPGGINRSFPLRFAEATIGRALDNDIVLETSDVSRHHARLERAGSLLRIVDQHSTNGTRVNGRRVEGHLLREGDTVELGNTRLYFRVGPPPEQR